MEIFLGRLSDRLWQRCSPPNSIFYHEEIFEFDQRLRRYRKREEGRARYFRRSSLKHTMLARGAVFDWHRVSYISWNASRRKERPGSVCWIINPDRRSISFSIHRPTPRFAFVARCPFESRIEYAIKESARFPSPVFFAIDGSVAWMDYVIHGISIHYGIFLLIDDQKGVAWKFQRTIC